MWKINALQLMAENCEEDSLVVTWLPDGILFEMSRHRVSTQRMMYVYGRLSVFVFTAKLN